MELHRKDFMGKFTQETIVQQIQASISVKQKILQDEDVLATIVYAANLCVSAYSLGHRLLIAGNGGSAADAQHIAAELVCRFEGDRPGLPAIALTTDTSTLTAVGNDYGYAALFSRQLQAHARPGDIFLAISTSGNSNNIVAAAEYAKANGIQTIGLTGHTGGKLKNLCDTCICVPSDSTARIQESHILIGHIFCKAIETAIFSGPEYNHQDSIQFVGTTDAWTA
jgi:D-sedoheptulose 7-phosphate isomerase